MVGDSACKFFHCLVLILFLDDILFFPNSIVFYLLASSVRKGTSTSLCTLLL